jgi:tetratricopeptide (TPR) repeat protein
MRAALQAVVAEVETSKLNDNEHFGTVFGRVIEVSEEKRQEVAEAVWQDGEAARGRGEADAAAALFEKAIDARGRGLCADDKQGRDRIVAMRRVLMEAKGGEEDKGEQARAKYALASDLDDQGEFEEALALYQEALELFTEVRFQYATSMCACACIALRRGLIFHDLYVSRAPAFAFCWGGVAACGLHFVFTTGFAFCCPLLTFCFYYRWAAKTPRTWRRRTTTSGQFTTAKASTRRRWKCTRNHSISRPASMVATTTRTWPHHLST